MKNSIVLLFVFCILFTIPICGCQGQNKSAETNRRDATQNLDTVQGLLEYLTPLPAVQSVKEWDNPYSQGLLIETNHYRIYTTMLEPLMLQQLPSFAEAAWNQYQSQIPSAVVQGEKFPLYLFKDRQQWEDFTRYWTGTNAPLYLKIKKGAYFLNDACVAYNIGRSRTFSVIGHEGWHQFCGRHFKYRLPSWLDEGIAQLFETSEFIEGKFVFTPAKNYQRLGALKISIAEGRIIPLQRLIGLNPGEVVLWEEADKGTLAFYSQAYGLVRFLREENYGRYLASYQQMLLGALNGSWPLSPAESQIAGSKSPPTIEWNRYLAQKLFDIYLGQSPQQIEPQYHNFCKKIVYHIRLK